VVSHVMGSCVLPSVKLIKTRITKPGVTLLPAGPFLVAASHKKLTFFPTVLQRTVSNVSQLVLDANGHRIRLGNWATCQLRVLDSVLLPENSACAIHSILFDLHEILIARRNTIWEAWRRATYLLRCRMPGTSPPLVCGSTL